MSRQSRRLNRWVDALLHDRRPRRLRGGEEDAAVLRAAIEMRAAAQGAGSPDPRFVADLQRRLGVETQGEPDRPGRLSRRRLLVGGGMTVAAAAAGVIVDRVVQGHDAERPRPESELLADRAGWIAVATVEAVPPGTAVRFSTGAIEGLVVNRGGVIEALSASCTHLGCIVTFNRGAGRLDCPCHNTAFGLDGSVLFHAYDVPLPPLPRVPSRIRDGHVEVLAV
jgi:nitrite reductase/ring-hydroxylating ferredoxin subunit